MAITYRSVKGSALTKEEVDENFSYLDNKFDEYALTTYVDEGDYESLTFVALQAKITALTLRPGAKYEISDYITKHIVPNDTVTNLAAAIAMGTTVSAEPIIVTADSTNTLKKTAYSPSTGHILEYDVTNILCEDSSTARNGFITRRIDTANHIDLPYDFRACYYLREEVDTATHLDFVNATSRSSSFSFTNGDTCVALSGVVQYPTGTTLSNTTVFSDGDFLYVNAGTVTYNSSSYTTGQTFTISTANGLQFTGSGTVYRIFDVPVGQSFVVQTTYGLSFIGAGAATKAYIENSIINVVGTGLYKALRPTASTSGFADTDWVKVINSANSLYWLTSASTVVAGSTITGNASTKQYFKTFGTSTYKNISALPKSDGTLNNIVIFGSTGTCKNIRFGADCYDITLDGTGLGNVVFEGNNYGWILDRSSSNIEVKLNSYQSTIGATATNVFIGKDSHYNAIGQSCNSINIAGTFSSNKIGKSCQWIVAGQDSGSNSIGNSCTDITIGDNSSGNKIGNSTAASVFEYGSGSNVIGSGSSLLRFRGISGNNRVMAGSSSLLFDSSSFNFLFSTGKTYSGLSLFSVNKKQFTATIGSAVSIYGADSSTSGDYTNYSATIPDHTIGNGYDTNLNIWGTKFSTAGVPSFYNLRTGATVNLPSGLSSPLTTKGDVWAYGTGDTRLPVGTDGYVLSADSTQATGLKWVVAGGGGDMVLASVQTVTGAKTFNSTKFILAGSTSGTTILNANATAGSGTVVLPITGTLATLAGTETFTNKTLTSPIVTSPTLTVGSDATGDIYYNGGSGALTRLAAGAAGTFVRYAGTGAAPTVSTLIVPNAIVANQVVFGSATNIYGASTGITYDDTNKRFRIGGGTTVGTYNVELNKDSTGSFLGVYNNNVSSSGGIDINNASSTGVVTGVAITMRLYGASVGNSPGAFSSTKSAILQTFGANQLVIGTADNTAPLYFLTNNVLRVTIAGGGDVAFASTTDASGTSGSVTIAGGAYLAKKLIVAGTTTLAANGLVIGANLPTQTLFTQTNDVTVGNSATATLLGTGTGTKTIAANGWAAGRVIRIKIYGQYTSGVTPSNAFNIKLGSTSLIAVAPVPPISQTGAGIFVEVIITCRTIGATGGFMAAISINYTNSTYNPNTFFFTTTSTVAIDTTASQAIDLVLTNGATESLTSYHTTIEQLN